MCMGNFISRNLSRNDWGTNSSKTNTALKTKNMIVPDQIDLPVRTESMNLNIPHQELQVIHPFHLRWSAHETGALSILLQGWPFHHKLPQHAGR